jgi:hypothetical protein
MAPNFDRVDIILISPMTIWPTLEDRDDNELQELQGSIALIL